MSVFETLRAAWARRKEQSISSYQELVLAVAADQEIAPKTAEQVLKAAGRELDQLEADVAVVRQVNALRAKAAQAADLLEQEREAFRAANEALKLLEAERARLAQEHKRLSDLAQRLNRQRLAAEKAGREADHLARRLLGNGHMQELDEVTREHGAARERLRKHEALTADVEKSLRELEDPRTRVIDRDRARRDIEFLRGRLAQLQAELPALAAAAAEKAAKVEQLDVVPV